MYYLLTFRERWEGEGEGEKHQILVCENPPVVYVTPPTGNLAPNPGMCPDQESNQRPFGLQAGATPARAIFHFLNSVLWSLLHVNFSNLHISWRYLKLDLLSGSTLIITGMTCHHSLPEIIHSKCNPGWVVCSLKQLLQLLITPQGIASLPHSLPHMTEAPLKPPKHNGP